MKQLSPINSGMEIKKAPTVLFPRIQTKDGYIVVVNEDSTTTRIGRDIRIKAIETDIDTDTVTYVLSFKFGGRDVETRVERGDLTKVKLPRLLSLGADIFDDNVTIVIKHLRNEEIVAPKINVHQQIGWGKYMGEPVYKHYLGVGVDSTFNGSLAIEPQGDFNAWENMIRAEVLSYTPLEMALVLGFSAITVGFVSQDLAFGSLVAHLGGDSTTGKSTAVMLAGSVAGCVDSKKSGLFGNWNSTRNAMMAQLRDNFGLPVIFDESSMSGIKDYSNILYALAEGKEKARMTKELDLREQTNWCTTILSTGEHGLILKSKQNAGLRVRILEFSNILWTKSAENSEIVKDVVLKNYGHAAPIFAKYLLNLGREEVTKRVETWRERCLLELDGADRFIQRSSLKLAILLATGALVQECFAFPIDLEAMLEFLLESERESVQDRDMGAKAYSYLLEQVVVHQHRFSRNYGELSCGVSEFEEVQGEHWGRWDHHASPKEIELSITKEAFKKILTDGGFEDTRVILSRWKQQGLLNCESDRYTRRRKLSPTSPTLDLYVVKIERELMQDASGQGKSSGGSRLPNGKTTLKVVGTCAQDAM